MTAHALGPARRAAVRRDILPPDLAADTRLFRMGVHVTLAMAAVSLVYIATTPGGPNRGWLLGITVAAALDAVVISRLPRRRIIERGWSTRFLAAWNAAHILVAAALCILDGGPASPYAAIFFLSVAFAAVTLPRAQVVEIAAFDIAALVAVAVLDRGLPGLWSGTTLVEGGGLAVTAAVCATIAGERLRGVLDLEESREEMLRRLARVVEYRDNDTGNHIERMSAYCELIAAALGVDEPQRRRLRLAATMHDIGKVAVPDAILLKPGRLTPEERTLVERHAEVGHQMLSGSGSDLLDLAARIASTHHERWDGAGYPRGLRGDDIPLVGRIVAVADVFDALTSDRVYKRAMPIEQAAAIIRDGRGTQFDPQVVDAFMAELDEIRSAQRRHSDPPERDRLGPRLRSDAERTAR